MTGPPGPCGCGCALTPKTSLGFSAVEFSRDVLGVEPLPWQRWFLIHAGELLADGRFRFRTILVMVARQNGKALDRETPILTANRGWTTMADIGVGDEVFHPAGHPTPVTYVSDVESGHECFQVTTTDGRTLVADAEHLWSVTDKRRSRSKGPRGRAARWFETRTLTTREMFAEGVSRYAAGGRSTTTDGKRYAANEYRFVLPVQEPLKSSDVELPVDPYLFGAWLGDGTSASASMTCHMDDAEHWAEAIEAAGFVPTVRPGGGTPATRTVGITATPGPGLQSRTLAGHLRRLGVLRDKHVPDAYLSAGTLQREALLQGLLDTDGSISRAGQVEFCSTSRRLADAAVFLARSLGWRATLREARATLDGRDCGPKYRVSFTPTRQDPHSPFRLERKAKRVKAADGGAGRSTVSIRSIEPVESRPVRCIKVESPDGLFLAGRDLVATHNTSIVEVKNLWKMYVLGVALVIGTAQNLDISEESWDKAVEIVESIPDLAAEVVHVDRTNGKKALRLSNGSRWKIAAASRKGGRGLSGDDVNLDELREHQNWQAWGAVSKTTMARPNAQTFAYSNAGDDRSVVLNTLQSTGRELARMAQEAAEAALSVLDIPEFDTSFGFFEWSAPDGVRCTCDRHGDDQPHGRDCRLRDEEAWEQANPALGYTITREAIESALATDPEGVFRTEVLCQRVRDLDEGIITTAQWVAVADPASQRTGDLSLGIDISTLRDFAAITVYGERPDGLGHCRLVDYRPGTQWVVARLAEMAAELNPVAIGMGKGTYESLRNELAAAGFELPEDPEFPHRGNLAVTTPTTMSAACAQFIDAVRQRSLRAVPSQQLDEAVAGAKIRATGDTIAWARKESAGDISPLAAATVTRWAHISRIGLVDSQPEEQPFYASWR